MKNVKTLVLFIAALSVVGLAACSSSTSSSPTPDDSSPTPVETETSSSGSGSGGSASGAECSSAALSKATVGEEGDDPSAGGVTITKFKCDGGFAVGSAPDADSAFFFKASGSNWGVIEDESVADMCAGKAPVVRNFPQELAQEYCDEYGSTS